MSLKPFLDVMQRLIHQYCDPSTIRVVTGGIPETTALLKHKFDYIFFTGSTTVGKIIGEAANKHLTPCTMELGGKGLGTKKINECPACCSWGQNFIFRAPWSWEVDLMRFFSGGSPQNFIICGIKF